MAAGDRSGRVDESASSARTRLNLAGWLGSAGFSLLADEIFTLALTFAALRSGSPGMVGAVVAAVSIGRGIMLLAGGAVADRVRRVQVSLTVFGLARAALMVVTATALWTGQFAGPVLVVLALAAGCFGGIFQPTIMSLPTHIASGSAVAQKRAGSLRTVVMRMSVLVGNAIAGGVIALGGASAGFALAGVLFLGSVLCLPVIRIPPVERPSTGVTPQKLIRSAVDGIRTMRSARGAGSVLLLIAMLNLGFAGPATVSIPIMAVHRGWGAAGAGWLLAGFGAGAAAAGIWLSVKPLRGHVVRAMLVSISGMAVCLIGIGLSPTYALTLVLAIVMGVASGISGSQSFPLITTNVPRDQVGRATALFELTMEVVSPISLAIAGAAATAGHASETFVVGGTLAAIGVAFAAAQRGVRTLRIES